MVRRSLLFSSPQRAIHLEPHNGRGLNFTWKNEAGRGPPQISQVISGWSAIFSFFSLLAGFKFFVSRVVWRDSLQALIAIEASSTSSEMSRPQFAIGAPLRRSEYMGHRVLRPTVPPMRAIVAAVFTNFKRACRSHLGFLNSRFGVNAHGPPSKPHYACGKRSAANT